MTKIPRRTFLGAAATSASSLLGACGGGGDDSGTAVVEPADALAPQQFQQALPTVIPPPPPPVGATGAASKYRYGQRYLFQSVSSRTLKSRLPGGADLPIDIFGPTYRYVDFHAGWPWTRPGGDWIDANLVRHGSKPWFSAPVDKAAGATVYRYTVDVTAAIAHCQVNKRWCALLLTASGAYRDIAAMAHPTEQPPFLMVTYANGSQARLNCRMVAVNSASSTQPGTFVSQVSLPAFTEFEPPAGAITKATLSLSVTTHWSGANPRLNGFLIDPPVNAHPVQQGVAAAAGPLDLNLAANPQVLGVHRYMDGAPLSAFVHAQPLNFYAEKNFDPAIYGTGARDLSKLPHAGLGKFVVGGADTMTVVGSGHTADGFAPLAPGMGALRLAMPAAPGITDGSVVGYGGTVAGNAMIYLPEAVFGRLPRIFVRYYVRIGLPSLATRANRRHVYHVPGQSDWTTFAGKFGIGPDHSTSYGGGSGTSGGGKGWQMRHGWTDCEAETGGPDERGWAPCYHMWDFNYQNPPGHNYGGRDGSRELDQWGQQGGLGGIFYAGQWYCVETELKLNTVSNTAPGFLADGAQRTWVDGRLAYERTGMVFRTGPVTPFAYDPERLRPCRDLGVRGLWLNWFHGGKTQNTIDRTLFYTGLAWSQSYIGPMRL